MIKSRHIEDSVPIPSTPQQQNLCHVSKTLFTEVFVCVLYGTDLKQSTSPIVLHVVNVSINNGDEKYICRPIDVPRLFMFHRAGTPASGVWVFSPHSCFLCSLLGMKICLLYTLSHVYCLIS